MKLSQIECKTSSPSLDYKGVIEQLIKENQDIKRKMLQVELQSEEKLKTMEKKINQYEMRGTSPPKNIKAIRDVQDTVKGTESSFDPHMSREMNENPSESEIANQSGSFVGQNTVEMMVPELYIEDAIPDQLPVKTTGDEYKEKIEISRHFDPHISDIAINPRPNQSVPGELSITEAF